MAKARQLETDPPVEKRTYLPGKERRERLLDTGLTLVREQGWGELSIAALAERAGISRQLVYRHFDDVEQLALELAERFQDEVYAAAVASLEHHPGDFASTMSQTVEVFLIGLRRERLVYYDLLAGHWPHPRLPRSLGRVRARLRRKLVEFWASYYELENGLSPRDAKALSSFQYSGLHGLVVLVDGGQLSAREAIEFFVSVLDAAIHQLGGQTAARGTRIERR